MFKEYYCALFHEYYLKVHVRDYLKSTGLVLLRYYARLYLQRQTE